MTMSRDELYSDTTAIFDFIFECFSEYDELVQQFIGLQESECYGFLAVLDAYRQMSLSHTEYIIA